MPPDDDRRVTERDLEAAVSELTLVIENAVIPIRVTQNNHERRIGNLEGSRAKWVDRALTFVVGLLVAGALIGLGISVSPAGLP